VHASPLLIYGGSFTSYLINHKLFYFYFLFLNKKAKIQKLSGIHHQKILLFLIDTLAKLILGIYLILEFGVMGILFG
jgi:hypothetical protein